MVLINRLFSLAALALSATAAPLLDYSAAQHDDPTKIGILNLEAARGSKVKANTPDLYIESGSDPKGTPALHYHRKEGDIRAEYHALPGKTQANQTYYIGYKFSLAETEKSNIIWQFKEYKANKDGGANIPLCLELIGDNQLQFQYQSGENVERKGQWTVPVEANTVYQVGLVIHTAHDATGWVEIYWGGKQQTFSSNGKDRLDGITTFPGQADPKFGAYGGDAVAIDTYVYDIQIGNELADIKRAAGIQ